jgi:acyl-CoA thioester hydrolase
MTTPRPPVFSTELRVRYAETDQMGVVYHAHYLVWCEVARTALIRELVSPYAQMEKEGLILAVADAHIRYHAPARYDDRIAVAVWVTAAQSRAVTFEYRVERVDDDGGPAIRLATAATRLIALDPAGATRRMPPQLVEKLRAAIPQQ